MKKMSMALALILAIFASNKAIAEDTKKTELKQYSITIQLPKHCKDPNLKMRKRKHWATENGIVPIINVHCKKQHEIEQLEPDYEIEIKTKRNKWQILLFDANIFSLNQITNVTHEYNNSHFETGYIIKEVK